MSAKTIGYWVATGLFSFALLGSATMDLWLPPDFKAQVVGHMGLPVWFPPVLGVWKLLGIVALLSPGFARIKEWAYAGFFFNLSGAIVGHLSIGDGLGGALPPAVLIAFLVTSYVLRPAGRALFEGSAGLTPARAG